MYASLPQPCLQSNFARAWRRWQIEHRHCHARRARACCGGVGPGPGPENAIIAVQPPAIAPFASLEATAPLHGGSSGVAEGGGDKQGCNDRLRHWRHGAAARGHLPGARAAAAPTRWATSPPPLLLDGAPLRAAAHEDVAAQIHTSWLQSLIGECVLAAAAGTGGAAGQQGVCEIGLVK